MSHVGRNIESLCINIKYISLYIYFYTLSIYIICIKVILDNVHTLNVSL